MQELKGSFVALVTPMKESGAVDYQALNSLVDWHIKSGINGIVSVGTTGESATLNFDDHIKVMTNTFKYINSRCIAIAGTGANSTQEALDLSKAANKIGYDYCLSVTPYYNKPTQTGLIKHYETIADAVDIAQILYNVPSRTACDLLPQSVRHLSKHPNIAGIKEAINTKERYIELINLSKEIKEKFYVLSGDDSTFYDLMVAGGDGVISVAANIVPKTIVEICNLITENDYDAAKEANKSIEDLYDLLFIESNPIPVKWILYKMGKIESGIRLPLTLLDENFHEETLSEMIKLKIL
tara:strand:+ start:22993 stop:23883 length:891 start_codon:yes stop_codon:yes gene_type:complete